MAFGIKMYPAGYYMHQSFEAALNIVVDGEIGPGDIWAIRIGTRQPVRPAISPFIPGR
jgi:hypothetical protein